MLSRIAEALYWMGRYLERADDTARLLDVHVHRALVEATGDGDGRPLLFAVGFDAISDIGWTDDDAALLAGTSLGVPTSLSAPPIGLWSVTDKLAYDHDNPNSVAGSLMLARENAAGLREVLNTEVWEALNRTHHELAQTVASARDFGPHLFFQWVRERVALIGGLVDNVLLHDDGWRFMMVGRCLERVDMTARLLRAIPPDADEGSWSGVLLSCGANDAFLRTHGGAIDRRRALEVLLQHPDFPRSASFSLRRAEECLRLIQTPGRSSRGRVVDALTADDGTVRILGRIRSELDYSSPEELDSDLTGVLQRLQHACIEASASLTEHYFRRVAFIEWSSEFAS